MVHDSKTDIDVGIAFTRAIAESGLEDVLLLEQATAERVLTDKRMQILRAIEAGEVASVSELARQLGRDKSIVSRDLDVLCEADVIDFEAGDGRAKRPVIAHETVLIKPLVFDGAVLDEDSESDERSVTA